MFIDIVFLFLMIMAVFKGISKGFIVAVFSLLAFIVGLAAALKLSATVADSLRSNGYTNGPWLPVLSFVIVFLAVAFLIRMASALLKKTANIFFLGWVDSLAGVILYAIIYLMIYSVILFYATKINIVPPETLLASKTHFFIEPLGPLVMTWLGKLIPWFSHMFSDLTRFFEGVAKKA